MEIIGRFINTSFKFTNEVIEPLISYTCDNEFYNHPNILFMEERYIEECKRFSNIQDKFKIKKFDDELLIYRNSQLEELEDYSTEVKLFNQIVAENNINGLNKNDLSISIQHFEEYNQNKKIKFIQYIYILLFLSNTTYYENNKFRFQIENNEKSMAEEVNFEEVHFFNLKKVYDWIMSSKENLQTRLRIIREIIIRKESFDLSEKDLHSAKSAFNRIVNEETEKYFIQVNMLKDDFLKLNEKKQSSYQSLHLKFLGWCTAIALFIFEELRDNENKNLIKDLFFLRTEKLILFLIIFIISLTLIWLIFVIEMYKNKIEFQKVREFYIEQLFFDEKDFSKFIVAPKISCTYKILFSFILVILFVRLFVSIV